MLPRTRHPIAHTSKGTKCISIKYILMTNAVSIIWKEVGCYL
jgi:hypothetical protein